MGKIFNISADCKPKLHYMVNIDDRLMEIRAMADRGDYFVINRARQYGKTTTLRALSRYLKRDYLTVSMDFQRIGASKFKNENTFSLTFARMFLQSVEEDPDSPKGIMGALKQSMQDEKEKGAFELFELFGHLSNFCGAASKPVVLMIDEVDYASDHPVFLDFLAQLRAYYIDRDITPTFQSVILAGVYDIKNMKSKIHPKKEHKGNSPWNIAVDFLVDMSFSQKDIAGMLTEYEQDHQTGMHVDQIAAWIYAYTSGYPFLVSYLCKMMDERIAGKDVWTKKGVLEAVRMMLAQQNTLFESLIHKLEEYPELREMLRELLFRGKEINYVVGVHSIEMALMLGFVKKRDYQIVPANRIFETLLYNWFLASPIVRKERIYDVALQDRNQFVRNGRLDMELVLEKFVQHFDELYGDRQQEFLEADGRRYFLLYLRPIINGAGNYYIESQTRNMERTDLIVDYAGEQFVIEMKIWRGNSYHERGEKQLAEYLEYYHLKKGYMLSFNFNKKKKIGLRTIQIGCSTILEAIV